MKNNKGFTLVELLVAVAILGIITGMSIPLIRNMQSSYEQKKYKQYAKAMVSSAKLYRDSYDNDLFGRKNSGCALVSLSELIEKDLISDYPDKNITCNYPQTMVRIVKINEQYGYSYQLSCGTDSTNIIFNDATFSKREGLFNRGENNPTESESEEEAVPDYGSFGGFDLSSCNMKNSMKIMATPDSGTDKSESYSVQVTASSSTGISTGGVNIQYAWVEAPAEAPAEAPEEETPIVDTGEDDDSDADDSDAEASDEIETVEVEDVEINYETITDWKFLSFSKLDNEATQTEKLVNSSVEDITTTAKSISPPTTTANKWYLVLKINRFQDLTGEQYPNQYEVFGEYNIAKKYTLTYDDNGGSGCSSTGQKIEKLLGRGENDVWGELCTPSRDDYIFSGWLDENNDLVTETTPINKNLTLHANWQKAKVIIRYKLMSNETIANSTTSTATPPVTYKWRKGSGDLIERSTDNGSTYTAISSSVAAGTNRTLDLANYDNSHYIKITSNSGYTRAKSGAEWICESGCKSTGQTFSHNRITINNTDNLCDTSHGDCTIYIRVNWDPSSLAAIPISLDKQGGTGGTAEIYSKNGKWYNTGNPGKNTAKITTITKPTRTGYSFGGYYTSKNGGGTQKITAAGAISASASSHTSATTWYAKWTPHVCTIKFSPNGGKFNSNTNNTTKTLKYGESSGDFWNAKGGYFNATRAGYTITSSKAWLLSGTTKTFDETKSYKATQICTSLNNKNQTVTLKVNWQPKKLKVTFNCNGGSGGGNQTFTFGTSNQKFSKTCTRLGYTLVGWAETKTATARKWRVENDVTDNWITANAPSKTIYAVWRKTVTVSFMANKASWMASTTKTCYSYNGSSCTVEAPSITFGELAQKKNKHNKTFSSILQIKGWNTSSTATTSSVASKGVVTVSGDRTYYTVIVLTKTNHTYTIAGTAADAYSSGGAPGLIHRASPSRSGSDKFTIMDGGRDKTGGPLDWAYNDGILWLKVNNISGDKRNIYNYTNPSWASFRYYN